MKHFVYIIECVNGNYYTGYTTDVRRRYEEHTRGSSKCRYTRSFPPKKLVVFWTLASKSDALSLESKIKKLPKSEKIKLFHIDVNELQERFKCGHKN